MTAVPRWTIAPDWADSASCASTDPEAFFPEKGGSTVAAKKVCRNCEVRPDCLIWTMLIEADEQNRHGVYGGLSVNERDRLALSGWSPDDPLPDVFLGRVTRAAGRCGYCGVATRNLRSHVRAAHSGVIVGAA